MQGADVGAGRRDLAAHEPQPRADRLGLSGAAGAAQGAQQRPALGLRVGEALAGRDHRTGDVVAGLRPRAHVGELGQRRERRVEPRARDSQVEAGGAAAAGAVDLRGGDEAVRLVRRPHDAVGHVVEVAGAGRERERRRALDLAVTHARGLAAGGRGRRLGGRRRLDRVLRRG